MNTRASFAPRRRNRHNVGMDTGIGPTLREARNRRKVDLSEVEAAIKIRVRYLQAMENEEWDALPGGAYTRGFIRTYASYLGLDGERLADDYRRSDRAAGRRAGAEAGRAGADGQRAGPAPDLGPPAHRGRLPRPGRRRGRHRAGRRGRRLVSSSVAGGEGRPEGATRSSAQEAGDGRQARCRDAAGGDGGSLGVPARRRRKAAGRRPDPR